MNKEDVEKLLNEKLEDGEHISPVLPKGIKNYLIDIDGTICNDVPNEEPERMATCEPYPDALEILNKWYEEGHIITFFSSRTVRARMIFAPKKTQTPWNTTPMPHPQTTHKNHSWPGFTPIFIANSRMFTRTYTVKCI